VAGRVDDVDVGDGAARIRPFDAGALGEDGDPALFLEVGRIHRPLLDSLVVAEGAGLAEQLVDEGRLAVIDVRDDRDVAKVHDFSREKVCRRCSRKRPLLQCSMKRRSHSIV